MWQLSTAAYYVLRENLFWSTSIIIIIQRKIIRSISSLPYNTPSDQYFKSMSALKVNDIHFFSISTSTIISIGKPLSLLTLSFIHITQGKKDSSMLPIFHLTKSLKAPNHCLIRSWDSLPNYNTACKTMKTLKPKLKENLDSQY